MEDKKYHINNTLVSAREMINKAKELDEDFAESHFYQTSVAADILRRNGNTVGDASEIIGTLSPT